MSELLKCESCGEKAAFVTTKSKLESLTGVKDSGDYFFKSGAACGGIAGQALGDIQLIPFKELIDLVKSVFNKLFGVFEDNNKKFVVCRGCGHYKLLE